MPGRSCPEREDAENTLIMAVSIRFPIRPGATPFLPSNDLSFESESERLLKEAGCIGMPCAETKKASQNLLRGGLLRGNLHRLTEVFGTPATICLTGILQKTETGSLRLQHPLLWPAAQEGACIEIENHSSGEGFLKGQLPVNPEFPCIVFRRPEV